MNQSKADANGVTIGHFWVTLCLCFKTSPSAKLLKWKWVWLTWRWTCRRNSVSYEWFSIKTRFHADAQGNSEMGYWFRFYFWLHEKKRDILNQSSSDIFKPILKHRKCKTYHFSTLEETTLVRVLLNSYIVLRKCFSKLLTLSTKFCILDCVYFCVFLAHC